LVTNLPGMQRLVQKEPKHCGFTHQKLWERKGEKNPICRILGERFTRKKRYRKHGAKPSLQDTTKKENFDIEGDPVSLDARAETHREVKRE